MATMMLNTSRCPLGASRRAQAARHTLTARVPLCHRRIVSVRASAEPQAPSKPASTGPVEYVEDSEFSISKVSFGSILTPIGLGLLIWGFGAYSTLLPGGDLSSLFLIYGFPISLLGFALSYAKLNPVPCKTTKAAFDLRASQMTDIQKQIREDVTRFRYGDEQHLEEALDRIFKPNRPGGVSRKLLPTLTGEWIIRQRPAAVVVETAMGPEHGSLAGNVIRCGDQVVDPTAGFFLRMFCQIGTSLQDYKDGDFTASPLWGQVRRSYNGEQLAYIGAFATGAPLVFGDRPKDITYRRLFGLTTIPQLDAGYSYTATQNYRSWLGLPPAPYDADTLPVTEQIMMQEREAVMLKVAHQLCHNALPQQQLAGGQPDSIALVVGSAHLPGLEHLWRSGKWREVVGCASPDTPLPASQLLEAPALPGLDSDPHYGLRRGLLEAMLRLGVTREVLADVETVLGPVPERHALAHGAVQEVYGSPRMQLASLPADLLAQLVVGLGCDFHEVLEPLRDIRPMNGGPGYSEDMVTYVRSLNFELE
ncbi:hypothetical protein GPECTOR_9g421 [Gonium pectorale]|uniref:Uncharacterized protein n=1 Tax=Gonium pectorale TaxID=33097 RepID=A0A150GRE4_GONPE|nr:hypothetical protein GPECTOR_9g421 [Gonium pectorale]|eukprot:KXZ52377.1 hypothetical protein GPECTOR_9g421 [Gonium pectorale]